MCVNVPRMPSGIRNGIRQRLRIRVEASKRSVAPRSSHGSHLRALYRTSRLSAAEIGETCRTVGAKAATDVAQMSAAASSRERVRHGNTQQDTRHSSRMLCRVLRRDASLRSALLAKVPQWGALRGKRMEADMEHSPIHETLDSMCNDCSDWLDVQPEHEEFHRRRRHWAHRTGCAGDLSQVAALGLWGDSAPTTKREGVHMLLFTSQMGRIQNKYWVTSFRKSALCRGGCKGKCTLEACWGFNAWTFTVLLSGIWPSCDPAGRKF